MRKYIIHRHHIYILASLLALVVLFTVVNITLENIFSQQPATFGVSYSPEFAVELGLNPRETYLDMLTNLRVKNIRLNAYWNEIEPAKGQFNFTELDWYISEAEKNQASVILAVGYKLPRWPECRKPEYLRNLSDLSYLRNLQLIMVEEVIRYYNQNPTVKIFQIENEPLLQFGACPYPDKAYFEREIALVKALTQKPILVTDSGELESWITPMQKSDIFGTTLYRKVNNPVFGELFYPLPPSFYRIKSELVRKIFAPHNQKTIVAELQAELWAGQEVADIPIEKQLQKFTLTQFQSNVNFAGRTGFSEFYLWGVEWWYYLAKNGHPEYLDYAKTLF